MTVLYEEKSQRAKSAEWLVLCFVILLLCGVGYTTYRSINLHTIFNCRIFLLKLWLSS